MCYNCAVQNVSGLNRHAKQQEVLNDPKNRLVTSYMNLIQYLQPNFILMEQVSLLAARLASATLHSKHRCINSNPLHQIYRVTNPVTQACNMAFSGA
jgi:hypothetical protein